MFIRTTVSDTVTLRGLRPGDEAHIIVRQSRRKNGKTRRGKREVIIHAPPHVTPVIGKILDTTTPDGLD